jgi:response regulator of citrate/malate metabolism
MSNTSVEIDFSKIKILIVEDDIIAQMALTKMLQEMGFTNILKENNYESSLSSFHKESPDLVILDIYLKGEKTGIDLAKVISSKIIYISASSDSQTMREVEKTDYKYFLYKPYNFVQIEKTIKKVLRGV